MNKEIIALYDRYDAAVIEANRAIATPRYDAALTEVRSTQRDLLELVAAGVAKNAV